MPDSPDPISTLDHAEDPVAAVVTVTVTEHGPYAVSGPVQVLDPEGRVIVAPPSSGLYLCRCALSATKPFCDGSHVAGGFDGSLAG